MIETCSNPSASRASLMAPTRPSIISLGLTTSAPARACDANVQTKLNKMIERMIPQHTSPLVLKSISKSNKDLFMLFSSSEI